MPSRLVTRKRLKREHFPSLPPARPLADRAVRVTMRESVKDGAAYSAMVGFGSSYLQAFAVFLGAQEQSIALLAALPQLVGSIGQELGAWLLWNVGSPKRTVLWTTLLQALVWVPLVALALFGVLPSDQGILLVILIATLLVLTDSLMHPAWVKLVGGIVPERVRGAYFSHRSRISDLVLFLATLAGGFILEKTAGWGAAALGFAVVFALALASRVYSFTRVRKHADTVALDGEVEYHAGPFTFAKQIKHTPLSGFLKYQVVFAFAVNIASPFFVLYMLRDLHYDYFTFGFLSAVEIIAKLVILPVWGKVVDRYGSRQVLRATGLLIPLVPILWLLPHGTPVWIFFVQLLSGFAWAGFDAATFTYLLDATTPENRAAATAHSSMAIGLTTFVGATVGGVLAFTANQTGSVVWLGLSGIPLLFVLSSLLRAAASILMTPGLKEVRPKVHAVHDTRFLWRVVTQYPIMGIQSELHQTQSTAHTIADMLKQRAVWMNHTFHPHTVLKKHQRRHTQ